MNLFGDVILFSIFTCSFKVLEVLLETCHAIIDSGADDMEYWLQGLERAAKATLLGHCLPMLVTAMTHPNLRCLLLADALMPQLVQLVVLTSQVSILNDQMLGFSLKFSFSGGTPPEKPSASNPTRWISQSWF
jgi:hypothetical protein